MQEKSTYEITNEQEYIEYWEEYSEYMENQTDSWCDLYDTNLWD